jgi:hypothetical protein
VIVFLVVGIIEKKCVNEDKNGKLRTYTDGCEVVAAVTCGSVADDKGGNDWSSI